MTREEIEKKLEELRRDRFLNQMIDHWSRADYEFDTRVSNEIKELEKQLAEMG